MLFKILRGNEANLPSKLTDGYCYYLKDKHYFYVDHLDDSNTLVRSKLSAEYADKLRYAEDGEMVEIAPEDIAMKSKLSQVALLASAWTGDGPYAQTITHPLIGPNTQIDIKASTDLLNRMEADGVLAIFVENNNGTATVRARGGKFGVDVVVSLTFTEIEIGA